MKISLCIERLQRIMQEHGDIDELAVLGPDARRTEYDSGTEDCAICHKATQNGVWGCDRCWDEIKMVCGEYLRLRQRTAFDQAHGLTTAHCPGYRRSDYGQAPTCKYCGLPPEALDAVKMTSTSLQSDMPPWPLNCTCLSISRDPLCVYHGDVDKVKAIMSKPELELYPPVTMPTWPPTWDDLQRLSRDFPGVYHTITLIERGDCTREQGLIWLTFALANAFQKLFTAEVDRRQREPHGPMLRPATKGENS